MSGHDLALLLLRRLRLHVSVARGFPNRYSPRDYTIYLQSSVYDGSDATCWAIAAHEVAHGYSHSRMGAGWLTLISRLEPLNYWLERAAWRRAIRLLVEHCGLSGDDLEWAQQTRDDCLRADGRRALAYCGWAAAVLLVALWLRE